MILISWHISLRYFLFFKSILICKPKQESVKLFHNESWMRVYYDRTFLITFLQYLKKFIYRHWQLDACKNRSKETPNVYISSVFIRRWSRHDSWHVLDWHYWKIYPTRTYVIECKTCSTDWKYINIHRRIQWGGCPI